MKLQTKYHHLWKKGNLVIAVSCSGMVQEQWAQNQSLRLVVSHNLILPSASRRISYYVHVQIPHTRFHSLGLYFKHPLIGTIFKFWLTPENPLLQVLTSRNCSLFFFFFFLISPCRRAVTKGTNGLRFSKEINKRKTEPN